MDAYEWYKDIKKYLQFLYTARQIGDTHIYKKWIDSFLSSHKYKAYIKEGPLIERVLRWNETLKSVF